MRILLTPIIFDDTILGSKRRLEIIAKNLIENGNEVAICCLEDQKISIDKITYYFVNKPVCNNLQELISEKLYWLSKKSGLYNLKSIETLEEIIKMSGSINSEYLKYDIESIRNIIIEFDPDFVYSEFRIASIIAAKIENRKCITSYFATSLKRFGHNPKYLEKIKELLEEYSIYSIESILDIFKMANIKIVPNCPSIEKVQANNTFFVGTFENLNIKKGAKDGYKTNILVNLENSILTHKQIENVFKNNKYYGEDKKVIIINDSEKQFSSINIKLKEEEFPTKILEDGLVFVHDGSYQNVIYSLLTGVPQIIIRNNTFENKYYSHIVEELGIGFELDNLRFNRREIAEFIEKIKDNEKMYEDSFKFGAELTKLGGVNKIIEIMEKEMKFRKK